MSYFSNPIQRREFLRDMALVTGGLLLPGAVPAAPAKPKKVRMKLGMVTYTWGADWDMATILQNLQEAGISGVELRTGHAHAIIPEMDKAQRKEVRKRFRGSDVEFVGFSTDLRFDHPERKLMLESIEKTKEYIRLSADIGGSGVKVQPNQFHTGVPKSRTVEQIGKSISQLARYGADYGQQVRLEVHGPETQEIGNMKAIMDVADHPNAKVCWNCNPEDLHGAGFKANFNLLSDRLGNTVHVRELEDPSYPYQELMNQLVGMNYRGWVLLECRTNPADKVKALAEQRKIWEEMVEKARNS